MAEVRKLRFNDLPQKTRQRLVETVTQKVRSGPNSPILAETISPMGRVVGWGCLLLPAAFMLAANLHERFGNPYFGGIQGPTYLPGYAVLWFVVAISALAMAYRLMLRRALPYTEGTFLLPLEVCKLERDEVTLTPLTLLSGITVTDHLRNGVYQHTTFAMNFTGAPGVVFTIGRNDSAVIKTKLDEARQKIRTAIEASDVAGIEAVDMFFEARQNDWKPGTDDKANPFLGAENNKPRAEELPPWIAKRLLLSLALGVVLAPTGWLVRNFLSDGEMFQRVKQENTSEVMRAYLRSRASRHRAEVQQMIYPKAFAEARKKGTVTAYRTMLVDYPASPFAEEARKEVHAVFVASLEKFKLRASGGDPESTPKVVAFFEQLIEYLEKQPTAQIAVYFRSPLTAPLAELDKTLAQKDVAPVAPHFTAESSRSRESAMVAAMQQGFSAIFPGDVLSLSHQLTPPSDATKLQKPSIEIKYLVSPTDALYKGKSSQRGFIGIRLDFLMKMRIPGSESELPIVLSVLPPDRFSVQFFTNRSRYAPSVGPRPGEGPSDSKVYSVMAERAFDQFESKLGQVLFGKKSDVIVPPPPPAPIPRAVSGDPLSDGDAAAGSKKKRRKK